MILLETSSKEQFKDVGNYVSYYRCVGSVHTSNGRKKGEGNAKNGNRFLACAYVEAPNFAIRYIEAAKKFYQRKKARRNGIVAIKAVAHNIRHTNTPLPTLNASLFMQCDSVFEECFTSIGRRATLSAMSLDLAFQILAAFSSVAPRTSIPRI